MVEIVGDFRATLNECSRLIERNRSYAADSGPVRNVGWNAWVMPLVDRLRRRIAVHESKIQLFIQPFTMQVPVPASITGSTASLLTLDGPIATSG